MASLVNPSSVLSDTLKCLKFVHLQCRSLSLGSLFVFPLSTGKYKKLPLYNVVLHEKKTPIAAYFATLFGGRGYIFHNIRYRYYGCPKELRPAL